MRKELFLTTLLMIASTGLWSQANLVDAFSKSYSLSYAQKYDQAAQTLLNVYDAKSYEINLRLGYIYFLAKDYAKSKQYYQKAIELMPMSVEAKIGMTYPLGGEGNTSKLIEIYNSILSTDVYNTYANYYLGFIYYTNKDYTNAHKYFERNVNLYPFTYDSVIMLAWTNLKLGKMNEAKVLFQKALVISPDDQSATSGLALCK